MVYSVWYKLGHSFVSVLVYSLDDAQREKERALKLGATKVSIQIPRVQQLEIEHERRCVAAYVAEGLGEY